MTRRYFKTDDFGPVVSAANAWESFKEQMAHKEKYHEYGGILATLRQSVSNELNEMGCNSAATHMGELVDRLLEELGQAKEEIEFLAKNCN